MKDIELDNLEKLIPSLANGAMHKAYLDTLSAGNSVLEVIDGAPYIKVDINKKIILG